LIKTRGSYVKVATQIIVYMKKIMIISIYLMVGLMVNSQVKPVQSDWLKQDKALHVSCSAALTCVFITLCEDHKISRNNSEIIGITASLAVGIGKEFMYDGYPDAKDLTADITGAIAGVFVTRLLQKWETKTYYKKNNNQKVTTKKPKNGR